MRSGGIVALFLGLASLAFGLVWAAVRLTAPEGGGPAAFAAGAAAALVVLGIWAGLRALVLAPLRRLERGLRAVRESRNADAGVGSIAAPLLGELPAECDALVTALRSTRREARKTAETESARVDTQRSWLEAIVQGLSEGVFVCSPQHRIMLYNPAAETLVQAPDKVGLGRSLGDLVMIAPIRHVFDQMQHRHAGGPETERELSAPFHCMTLDGTRMFNGRIALLSDAGGKVTGYLVTLVDASKELAHLAREDAARRALSRDMRGMAGNLRAAAETMVDHPDMAAGKRAEFERVVLDESRRISDKLDELGAEVGDRMSGRWPMADIHAADLVRCVAQDLEDAGIRASLVGVPLWLHGDSLALIRAIGFLIRQVAEKTGARDFEIEPLLGDHLVYLDLVWSGEPVAESVLENWQDMTCTQDTGGQRLGDILERHLSVPWSRAAAGQGQAMLRLPLPAAHRPQFAPSPRRLPARPEFYDFSLMRAHRGDEALATRPLRDIEYAVFDCEMTGLQPMRGDEIIQIGAVRILRGRVLTGEGREWLVNPGRPIPPGSIRFHGLTDADVAGAPPIGAVLPAFRDFVDDAVMVGHNVAFDMKFIALKEKAAGVHLDNPLLDTMLVSLMLDGQEEDHSLDALCDRYGVPIVGRHTALGDTIATAELLMRMIDRLEAKGLSTFGAVMKASNMAADLRQRAAIVAHGANPSG